MFQNAWEGLYFDSRKYVTFSQPQQDAINLVRDIQKTITEKEQTENSPNPKPREPKFEIDEIDIGKEPKAAQRADKNTGDNSGLGLKTLKSNEQS